MATSVERASRLIVLVSIALASAVHAWLAHPHTALAMVTLVTFAASFALARLWPAAALAVVGVSAFTAPALLTAVLGTYDYHHLGLWLAALAGLLFAHADLARWHFPRRWKLALAGWALVLAVTWPVVAARELDFSLIAARSDDVVNGIMQLTPPRAAAFVVLMALSQLLGLMWLEFLWVSRRRFDGRAYARRIALPLAAGVAASAAVGLVQRLVDLEFLNLPIWSNLQRAGGLMNDANSFGMGAALWAPLGVAMAWTLSLRPATAVSLFALLASGMWSSGSRTALLAFVIGTAGVLIALLQRRGVWRPRVARLSAGLALVAVVLAIALVPREFESGNPLRRAFDRLPRLEAAEMHRFLVEDLWVRFGYGQAAVDVVKEYPVAGVGVGAFHLVGPDYVYRATGRAVASDNAQNWWRHQVAELGLLGAIPALWASVLVVLLLRGHRDAEPVGAITAVRGSLVGIGIASLLGMPTQHPATWLSFATAVVWLDALLRPLPEAAAPPARGAWIAMFALAGTVAAGLLLSAQGGLRPATRAAATATPYSYGLSSSEGLSDFGEFRVAAVDAIAVVPVSQPWLQLTFWAPYSDVRAREIRTEVLVNGRTVISHDVESSDAFSYVIGMPPGAEWATIELRVSGRVPRQRALQMAMAWRQAPPSDVPPDRVVP